MTDQPRPDDVVLDWIRSGPELAPPEFVDRTMRPIPRMRQRRAWRIGLDRVVTPAGAVLGAAAVVALAVVSFGLFWSLGPAGLLPGSSPTPSGPPVGLRPSFELTVGSQRFVSDPAAAVATCAGDDDGSWSVLYAGGEPLVSLDLVVGSGTERPGGESRVGAELTAAGTYVRFDPAVLRGGDPPGRSTAEVTVTTDGPATTFVVTATTPNRTGGFDGPPVDIALTLTCAPPS